MPLPPPLGFFLLLPLMQILRPEGQPRPLPPSLEGLLEGAASFLIPTGLVLILIGGMPSWRASRSAWGQVLSHWGTTALLVGLLCPVAAYFIPTWLGWTLVVLAVIVVPMWAYRRRPALRRPGGAADPFSEGT